MSVAFSVEKNATLISTLNSTNLDTLLVIDVQNCFLPGGSLEVGEGAQVIPVINSIRDQFDVVVLTQDWHCPQHISFASQHPE